MNKHLCSLLLLLVTMLFVSCGSNVPPMPSDYADAVTNINQVDPYYRACFRAQNGANYSLADQRTAYIAAMQTARTPVRASEYGSATRSSRLATRSSRKAASNRRAVASRRAGSKKTVKRRAVARGGKSAKRSSKPRARRATASRRSTRSRRG